LEHGLDVSTRAIAAAAGVAEGTIFRYFETKRDLLVQAIRTALEPSQLVSEVEAIALDQPLPQRIDCLIRLLLEASHRTRSLMMVMHTPQARFVFGRDGRFDPAGKFGPHRGFDPADRCDPADHCDRAAEADPADRFGPAWRGRPTAGGWGSRRGPDGSWKAGLWGDHQSELELRGQALLEAIAAVLAPDRERLAVDLEVAAAYIRLLALASAMPPLAHPGLQDPTVVSRLVLGALLDCQNTKDRQ
jgi:AcrR family transcriptional regulator